MAAGPWIVFDAFIDEKNSGTHDLSTGNTDVYKVALYVQAYVPNVTTETIYAVTNEVAELNTGYTAAGQVEVVTLDTSVAGEVIINIVSPDWTAGTANLVCATAVIYNSTKSNKLVAHCQLDNTVPGTPADITVTDTNTLTINTAAGIFTEQRQ